MTTRIRIGEGLGNDWTSGGILALAQAAKAACPQADIEVFGDTLDETVRELTSFPASDRIIIGGYSRGADYAPTIAKRIVRPVAYLFMFQPSIYYPTSEIGPNVKKGFCVYNPYFWQTGGLGAQRVYKTEGNNVTEMEVLMAPDTHPAVQFNPLYQSRVLREISSVVKGA